MTSFPLIAIPLLVCAAPLPAAVFASGPEDASKAEARALAYLVREVPRWSQENHCYSCHNNGDATRALYAAVRLGRAVPPVALADTTRWLTGPDGWDHNGGEGPYSDKRLARIQFAAALGLAVEVGQVKDRSVLVRAAERVAADQAEDGSWPIEDAGSAGSPAAYGRPLATAMACGVLRQAGTAKFAAALRKGERWLCRIRVVSIPDAAAVQLACGSSRDPDAVAQCGRSLELLRQSQGADGGWGPFRNAPPEPFDTAIALLALKAMPADADREAMIVRGRDYLIATQLDNGSWPETTRPAGAESYAQRLSTAGWATLSLLKTAGAGRSP